MQQWVSAFSLVYYACKLATVGVFINWLFNP
jgi:hypothetical protein